MTRLIQKVTSPIAAATNGAQARALSLLRAVVHGDLALMVLVWLVYLRPPPGLKLFNARWVGVFLLLTIVWRWAVDREWPRPSLSAVLPVWGYVLVGLASLTVAGDHERASVALIRLAKDAILCTIIVFLVRRRVTLERVVWTVLSAGGLMSTLGVYQWLTGTFDREYLGLARAELGHIIGNVDAYKVLGPVGDPNFYAQVLLPLMALAFGQIWDAPRWHLRCAAVWVFEASAFAVVLTHSRAGFVGALVLLGMIGVVWRPRVAAVGILVLLLAPVVWYAPSSYHLRIGTLGDIASGRVSSLTRKPTKAAEMKREPGLRGRVSENVAGGLMFAERPILGVGLGNYEGHYQAYARRVPIDGHQEDRKAHNLYLEIAAETGILGVVAFGAILLVACRRSLRERRRLLTAGRLYDARLVTSVVMAFVAYLVVSLFLHAANTGHFGLLLGLVLALPGATGREASPPFGDADRVS